MGFQPSSIVILIFTGLLVQEVLMIVVSNAGKRSGKQSCLKCACGSSGIAPRIVGGMDAPINKYPWMAMLLRNGRFYCGGTLINNKYVLTAAHCARNVNSNSLSIVLSTSSISNISQGTLRKAQQIISHPNFNPRNFDNDLALIKLDKDVVYNMNIKSVCLPNGSKNYAGENGTIAGWGTTSEKGALSQKLKEGYLPILSNTDCSKKLTITSNMICAGFNNGKVDTCQGDSGGGLYVVERNKYYEVGIVSWGAGCGKPNSPGAYTRTTNYNNWIQTNTNDACYCS